METVEKLQFSKLFWGTHQIIAQGGEVALGDFGLLTSVFVNPGYSPAGSVRKLHVGLWRFSSCTSHVITDK